MKARFWIRLLLVFGWAFIVTHTIDAQETSSDGLLLISVYRLLFLDSQNGVVTDISAAYTFSEDSESSFSPGRTVLAYWNFEQPLTDGLWLLNLPTDDVKRIPILSGSEANLEFAYVQWPFGERFVLVFAGIFIQPEISPRPVEKITHAWLVDIEQAIVTPWYWGCNEVIHLAEENTFGLYCTRNDLKADEPVASAVILSSAGVLQDQETKYDLIHTRTFFSSISWSFSLEMSQVVFFDEGLDFTLIAKLYTLDTNRTTVIAVYEWHGFGDFLWSSSEKYVAISAIPNQFEIVDIEAGRSRWNSKETLNTGEFVSYADFAWKSDGNGFYVLRGIGAVNYISDFSLNEEEVILNQTWQVSLSVYRIAAWQYVSSN